MPNQNKIKKADSLLAGLRQALAASDLDRLPLAQALLELALEGIYPADSGDTEIFHVTLTDIILEATRECGRRLLSERNFILPNRISVSD